MSDKDKLSTQLENRGVSPGQWHTLARNLYPGAKIESVLMVIDYCKSRGLDPLKKPCHIVPMKVKDAATGKEEWRDVVMPGIYEQRMTAQKTGEYLGHSKPEYGEMTDFLGVQAPEWCHMVIYRWNAAAEQRAEYPVTVYFSEACTTRWDKDAKQRVPNARWTLAPRQMLTKCTEAAGLREAFPDELGGHMVMEEMEGRDIIDGEAYQVVEREAPLMSKIAARKIIRKLVELADHEDADGVYEIYAEQSPDEWAYLMSCPERPDYINVEKINRMIDVVDSRPAPEPEGVAL